MIPSMLSTQTEQASAPDGRIQSSQIDWSQGHSLVSDDDLADYLVEIEELDASDDVKIEMIYAWATALWYIIGVRFGIDPVSLAMPEPAVDKSLTTSAETVFPPQNMVRSEHAKSEERPADD